MCWRFAALREVEENTPIVGHDAPEADFAALGFDALDLQPSPLHAAAMHAPATGLFRNVRGSGKEAACAGRSRTNPSSPESAGDTLMYPRSREFEARQQLCETKTANNHFSTFRPPEAENCISALRGVSHPVPQRWARKMMCGST